MTCAASSSTRVRKRFAEGQTGSPPADSAGASDGRPGRTGRRAPGPAGSRRGGGLRLRRHRRCGDVGGRGHGTGARHGVRLRGRGHRDDGRGGRLALGDGRCARRAGDPAAATTRARRLRGSVGHRVRRGRAGCLDGRYDGARCCACGCNSDRTRVRGGRAARCSRARRAVRLRRLPRLRCRSGGRRSGGLRRAAAGRQRVPRSAGATPAACGVRHGCDACPRIGGERGGLGRLSDRLGGHVHGHRRPPPR